MQPFADGGQQDDRGNADGNAQRGEEGTQPVGGQGGERKADEVGVAHGHLRDNACTGSRLAARRAGTTVNTTAVTTAVAGAASKAHQGAVNGIAG